MKIFAIDLSSSFGGIALLEDGVVTDVQYWEENFKNRQQLFDAMKGLDVDWNTVDLFAVGRGPGAFSGMRIGFTVINALAAPLKKPVYALSSGAVLASQLISDETVVVGDARREKVWAGLFRDDELVGDYELMEYDAFREFVPEEALVVSPDRDRLEELLADFNGPEESFYPSPRKLAELVYERVKAGVESEPFEPLYMHPPVFIAPRFPA